MSKPAQMWWMRNPIMDRPRQTNARPPPKYKANLHDIEYLDDIDDKDDEEESVEDAEEDIGGDDTPDETETGVDKNELLSFITKQQAM